MAFSWLPETTGILGSVSLLVALAALLAAYDDKAIFEWKGVTLNAIVSVISTASKASLLYAISELISQWKWIIFTDVRRPLMDFENVDSASRGPLGSLKLMWKCKSIGFLRLGALVVLLSIAADPLTQQLVQYKHRLVYTEDAETIVNRAGRFSKGSEITLTTAAMQSSYLNTSTAVIADADFSVQSAILYGVGQSVHNVVQQGISNCPTGNCSWPSFESLAVCSRCTDLTANLELSVTSNDYPQYLDLQRDPGGLFVPENGTTDFQLPNGLLLGNTNGWRYGDRQGVIMTTFGTPDPSETVNSHGLETLIWSTSIIRSYQDPMNTSAAWPDLPLSAVECALYYCVRSYKNEMSNGILQDNSEEVTDFSRVKESWQLEAGNLDTSRMNESQINSIAYNSLISTISHTDLMLSSPSGAWFNISQAAVDSISSFYQSTFTDPKRKGRKRGTNGSYLISQKPQWNPSVIQALFESKDFEETFTALATSMSNAIRSGADEVFEEIPIRVAGMKGEMSTFYRIVWPWISFHCFIVTLGVVFLGLTMWENQRHGRQVPLWRSSGLAIASRGETVTDVLSGIETLEEMWKRAKSSRLALFDKKDGADSSLEHLEFDPLEVAS